MFHSTTFNLRCLAFDWLETNVVKISEFRRKVEYYEFILPSINVCTEL